MMKRVKNSIMLNCETASMFISKSEYEKLSFWDNFRLKLHLLSCKFCRRFNIQSKFLSESLHQLAHDHEHIHHCLTPEQKEKLQKSIEKDYN